MIEYAQYLLLTNPLGFYTAIVATLGIAFWMLNRRSIRAALKATNGTEINALQSERQKTEASVEQSFATIQLRAKPLETPGATTDGEMGQHFVHPYAPPKSKKRYSSLSWPRWHIWSSSKHQHHTPVDAMSRNWQLTFRKPIAHRWSSLGSLHNCLNPRTVFTDPLRTDDQVLRVCCVRGLKADLRGKRKCIYVNSLRGYCV